MKKKTRDTSPKASRSSQDPRGERPVAAADDPADGADRSQPVKTKRKVPFRGLPKR